MIRAPATSTRTHCPAAPRRWVAARAGVSPVDELEHVTRRIKANFSNYSAWHERTRLLPLVEHGAQQCAGLSRQGFGGCENALHISDGDVCQACNNGAATLANASRTATDDVDRDGGNSATPVVVQRRLSPATLRSEFELVRSAVFTEPDDQSPWLYRRWLLAEAGRYFVGSPAAVATSFPSMHVPECAAVAALLQEDLMQLRELAAAAPSSKWPRLGLAQSLAVVIAWWAESSDDAAHARGVAEAAQLYHELARDDAQRAAYYEHAAAAIGSARP